MAKPIHSHDPIAWMAILTAQAAGLTCPLWLANMRPIQQILIALQLCCHFRLGQKPDH
jgi:hypothetical protein